jgi:hypothetical protein
MILQAREEKIVFNELSELCKSPGFVHAIAYFCYRDNMVFFEDKMKTDDMTHLFSIKRLIRTEISTLIGLMIQDDVVYTLPSPDVVHHYRKGLNHEPRLSFAAHLLTENQNGLVITSAVTIADGFAERETAKAMIAKVAPRKRRISIAADRNYDTRGFVTAMRELNVTPHVTQNITKKGRRSSIDGRTTRHTSYAASQKFRKRIEEVFGWLKTVGLFRKTRYRGIKKIDWHFTLAVTAYNLVRMRNLGICAT